MKLVLDTNVIVGTTMSTYGAVANLRKHLALKHFTLVTSISILNEVTAALHYKHIATRHQWTEARMQVFLNTLKYKALIVPGIKPLDIILNDTSDEKFLSCAIEAHAEAVITGDNGLLQLKSYHGIPIITARDCLKKFFPEK